MHTGWFTSRWLSQNRTGISFIRTPGMDSAYYVSSTEKANHSSSAGRSAWWLEREAFLREAEFRKLTISFTNHQAVIRVGRSSRSNFADAVWGHSTEGMFDTK
jgi:hypothetical protein